MRTRRRETSVPDAETADELRARLAELRAKREEAQGQPATVEGSSPESDHTAKQAHLDRLRDQVAERQQAEQDATAIDTALTEAFANPAALRRLRPDQAEAARQRIEEQGLVQVVDGEVCFVDGDREPEPLDAGVRRWLMRDPVARAEYAAPLGVHGSGDRPKPYGADGWGSRRLTELLKQDKAKADGAHQKLRDAIVYGLANRE